LIGEAYPDATKDAADETGLPLDRFPVECPYARDDVLAEDYLPDESF
jgi:hypothetical protein